MLFPTKVVELNPRDHEHIKRLNDPADAGLFHLETWLPFSEVENWIAATQTLDPHPRERNRSATW